MWLAALACLSLAAKLEEVAVPSTISALQVCLLDGYAEVRELKQNLDSRHRHCHQCCRPAQVFCCQVALVHDCCCRLAYNI